MINTDKAYILGLVVGGGSFSTDKRSFYIKLPYKQWGDMAKNPDRAGVIAKDIIKVVGPLMKSEYDLSVSYVTRPDWRIECFGDTEKLVQDLESFGIQATAEIRKNADISKLVSQLVDDNLKRRFIAGVADTIGSMAESQRRFSSDCQIISFEINGFAFKFVCQLCNLLYSVGCLPDQILWQHPNMQSGKDAYYKQWKKGNKLRVTLDAFSQFGALAFKSKAVASSENRAKQNKTNVAERCETKSLSASGVTAYHTDENYHDLPDNIRGGHYIHHKQICAALNCPHAPKGELKCLLSKAAYHVSPFTVLTKGTSSEISSIIAHDELLSKRKYSRVETSVYRVVKANELGQTTVLFDNDTANFSFSVDVGYPINYLLDAIAYILASRTGALHGKRVAGNRDDMLLQAIKKNPGETVSILVPDLLTPIIVTDDKVSAMVGPLNAPVYEKLISYDTQNEFKMILRKITEEDLK